MKEIPSTTTGFSSYKHKYETSKEQPVVCKSSLKWPSVSEEQNVIKMYLLDMGIDMI